MRRPGLEDRCRIRPGLAGYRRSGLSLPTTNLMLQLDARVGVTEGATFAWADQSGNGNDATQGTGANQPSVETNGTLGTVVRFNGTSDWLDVTGLATTDGDWTVFCVMDLQTNGTNQNVLDAQTGRAALQATNTFGSVGIFDGNTRQLGPDATGVQVVTWRQENGGALSAYRASSLNGSTTSGGNALGGTTYIGANFAGSGAYLDADVAFLGVYDEALDASGRAAVWNYIAQEWPGAGL